MVKLRGTYLAIPLLILSWSIIPILGLQSSSQNISSYGTVKYPERHEIGVWYIGMTIEVPEEASWLGVKSPVYGKSNLLENPGFEFDFLGWRLYTPPDKTALLVDILPGYVGNSAVMVSDDLGYKGGFSQSFLKEPPNTTFHYKAV